MLASGQEWRPGSFTKNYSWGPPSDGLKRLHEAILIGFSGELSPVLRDTFRRRLKRHERPDYIPLNFFLLNRVIDGQSYIVPDELVFQAIQFDHGRAFDKLALAVFNLSYVGRWSGARPYQAYPAVWANEYIRSRVAEARNWDVGLITADDIQRFVRSNPKYTGDTSRKLSTNLSYMYNIGGLHEMSQPQIERWWVDAAFAALDRAVDERDEHNQEVPVQRLVQYLARSRFTLLTGGQSLNKDLAIQPIATLYGACGGMNRLSREAVEERQRLKLPHIQWFANSDDPFFAIYPQDPNVIKSIPRACAMLAKELAHFEELDPDELENWNVLEYVRTKTRAALQLLRQRGVGPNISAEELMKMTRGE